jgi:septal ring factor EnvC (AmiA/AmiB activator)
MTLTSLLAFASGAVMARFKKEPVLEEKDQRIAELEALCDRFGIATSSLSAHLTEARAESAALRQTLRQTRAEITDLYAGVYARPLSPEQQAEFARQFGEQRNPQFQMQAGLAYPVPGQVLRELSEFDWRSCTCVPGRADALRRIVEPDGRISRQRDL